MAPARESMDTTRGYALADSGLGCGGRSAGGMTGREDPYAQLRIPSVGGAGRCLRDRQGLRAQAIMRMMFGRSADAAGVGFQERLGGMLSMMIVGGDEVARAERVGCGMVVREGGPEHEAQAEPGESPEGFTSRPRHAEGISTSPRSAATRERHPGSPASRKLDLRALRIGSVEHDGVSDDAAERRPAGLGELACQLLLGLGLTQADLDQLVAFEGFVEGTQQGLAQAALADDDDRSERMGQAAKMTSLGAVEDGRGGTSGARGIGGHGGRA